jgi:hypothetical protein
VQRNVTPTPYVRFKASSYETTYQYIRRHNPKGHRRQNVKRYQKLITNLNRPDLICKVQEEWFSLPSAHHKGFSGTPPLYTPRKRSTLLRKMAFQGGWWTNYPRIVSKRRVLLKRQSTQTKKKGKRKEVRFNKAGNVHTK